MNILGTTKKSLKELTAGYTEYFQAQENLKMNKNFELNENTKTLIDKFEDLGARIIIRSSGTEPVLRLMVEHKDKQTATKFLEFLKSSIE